MHLNKDYWDEQYQNGRTGWDVGYISTPIKEYVDQLTDKELRILVPGAGNAWEVEYLFQQGFKNVFLLDFSEKAVEQFLERVPQFPEDHIIVGDFFQHQGGYDLILEQTFFTSFSPERRPEYVLKMHDLLAQDGKLSGLFFNHQFKFDGPPFGGTATEYKHLFSPLFDFKIFETAHNSIKPRLGNELFFVFVKK
ncbi:MAG: hypothetical protein JEZ03_01145 [Bacteroidales bacterium]|nr:hypothetical protein [Bacteroidales bacterium]